MADSLDGQHVASADYRMSGSLSMACDYYYDPFCEVCFETRNQNIKHEGFCNECNQFLCGECLRVHRKLQGTRGHVIRRGDDMPKSMADKPPTFDYCEVHQRFPKDQFCGSHKTLLCSQCVPLQHNDCPVESVHDACKGVSSSEIDALYETVSEFKTNLSSVVTQLDRNVTDLGQQKVNLLQNAQDLKDKGIAKIEKLFQEITSETKSTYKTYTSDLSRDKGKLNDLVEILESTLDDIDKMKGSTVDTKIFLRIQDILKEVEQCKSDAGKLRPSAMNVKWLCNVKLSFTLEKVFGELLSSSFKMGSISIDTSQPQVAILLPEISFPISHQSLPTLQGLSGRTSAGAKRHVAMITMPLSQITALKIAGYNTKLDNEPACVISDIAFTSDDRRLLADSSNKKIKLFSRDMRPLCSLSLPLSPWGITVTGDGEAVVSSAEGNFLHFLDISDNKMSIKRTVKPPFLVAGIAPYKEKLLVSAWHVPRSDSIKLIDKIGRVYWSTDTDQQGQKLFSYPGYMTRYRDGGSVAVIVSESGHLHAFGPNNNVLTVLNAETGDVIARRDMEGKCPSGITTDTAGNIYVCYHETGEVAVLTKDLSQDKVLLCKRDGLSRYPLAIVYNAIDNQLLVSYDRISGSSTHVDCFEIQ